VRQQFIVNKYLDHVKEVLNLAWKLFQRMGPDEKFFQVTGNPDGMTMTKGDPDENFSLMVSFDTRENDPEHIKRKAESASSLLQIDRNGRMNTDKLIGVILGGIDPFLADYILEPEDETQKRMAKDVQNDLVSIYSGIEQDARPNGAQMAMQMIQQYTQQPDIMQRLQDDESFAARLQKYAQQYQFQMQQAENAVIGRMGTAPAQMGGAPTAPLQE